MSARPGGARARAFDLALTLGSGQFFRYWPLDGGYVIAARGKVFFVRQNDFRLEFSGIAPAALRRFFALDDRSVDSLAVSVEDPKLRGIIRRYPGLRLLRQDPWECLLAFVCSTFSNIPRIRRLLDSICRTYGTPVSFRGQTWYEVPRPGRLGDERGLRRLGAGFRARYLAEAARVVTREHLASLAPKSYAQTRRALLELPGVGEKVADCVSLFAYGHREAFPVDTWIRRVMRRWYCGRSATDREIEQYAHDHFGPQAGLAQQYLYVYVRENWRQRGY